jgi:hypothetical protein
VAVYCSLHQASPKAATSCIEAITVFVEGAAHQQGTPSNWKFAPLGVTPPDYFGAMGVLVNGGYRHSPRTRPGGPDALLQVRCGLAMAARFISVAACMGRIVEGPQTGPADRPVGRITRTVCTVTRHIPT